MKKNLSDLIVDTLFESKREMSTDELAEIVQKKRKLPTSPRTVASYVTSREPSKFCIRTKPAHYIHKKHKDITKKRAGKKNENSNETDTEFSRNPYQESEPDTNYRDHKDRLISDQGGFCNSCHEALAKKNSQVDHIIPITRGGTNHFDNLQVLCTNCNQVKGKRTMEEFRPNWKKNIKERDLDLFLEDINDSLSFLIIKNLKQLLKNAKNIVNRNID